MSNNFLQSFIFDNADIRGAIIKLDSSFIEMLEHQNYDAAQQELLAQFVAANLLMSSHIKFEGLLSLQARGEKDVSMVMTECTDQLSFRGILQGEEALTEQDFSQLFAGGVLAITIEPKQGQRYQGVAPLEKNTLADCLAQYFEQSEQLTSWFFIAHHEGKVAAMMLQALPASQKDLEQKEEDWQRITQLANTLSAEEIITLASEDILYRLFHEEEVRLFEPKAAQFECSCSLERMERALISLGSEELLQIIEDDGKIDTQCHFCNKTYHFNPEQITQLIQAGSTH